MSDKRNTRKKEEHVNSEIIVTDDAKILHQLAQQSLILVTQFDTIEKRLDKTIEILDKILKINKLQIGIYE